MNLKKVIVSAAAATVLLGSLSACAQKSTVAANQAMSRAVSYDAGASYSTGDMLFESAAPVALGAEASADTAIPLPENRKWVITMNLSAETGSLDDAMARLNEEIQAVSGYVESQSISGNAASGQSRSAYLTIRVPAEALDGFIAQVSGLANVVSTTRRVEDITLSYTDTEGRLNALKTEEARLLELMEQAETMSDLLEIEARLTEVRYQLENYTSALRLYDNQVDYATVSLSLREVEKYTPAENQSFWDKVTTGLRDSVENLGRSIVDFLSWLIIDLPYLVVIALLAWLVTALTRRAIRKWKAKKAKEEKAE